MSMANLNISREFLHVENEKSIFFLHLFHFFSFSDNTIEFGGESSGINAEYGGAKALADALKVSVSITAVNLRGIYSSKQKKFLIFFTLFLLGNSISNEGANALADALKTSVSMRNLNLRDNSLNFTGAKALAAGLMVSASMTNLNFRCEIP
eukprot:TRINITY_DN2433_c1_g1_i1.p1 TRINITY_DN2433_c1_g1~~TRINITY_DN2433_c1_g1_i1.p1  ORF type:complete len:161 (-),score=47.21 TRINITY_DN2433_c1_g1_i1:552-1007(-)